MMQIIYLLLCILGFVLPYSQFIPFILENGLDIKLFFDQLFANQISGFFGMDVIISSLTFWTLVFWEGTSLKMRNLWIYVLCNLLVGVSFGLPLFLLMRQRKIEQQSEIPNY
ncbi:DUF2834 domain-containing protein [Calothrix sp. FACHB-1219]|uniref:DUF2834 domain-containing protein n=1 Tax=unclassified Calothrix TaxID=2619626 RepID=UPI001684EC2F|nr:MULTISPECIES: DUF2834 domain-containing protein [unclassified Calothrix]MBD2202128.1 DUF2834 domain-containing protein [Calothrix sp. FACHB-168]MBD2217162.1 DUF2834 domain-containing protein [Calothrix sp. FACHB-1219]